MCRVLTAVPADLKIPYPYPSSLPAAFGMLVVIVAARTLLIKSSG
jgi:hypothetical protein